MNREAERVPRSLFEPSCYRYAPRLFDEGATYRFNEHRVDVFFMSLQEVPKPVARRARRVNTQNAVNHELWEIEDIRRLKSERSGAWAGKLCFRAEEFSARLRELGPLGECQQTRNLLQLFILGGRLHIDFAIDGDSTTPLLIDLSYRRPPRQ